MCYKDGNPITRYYYGDIGSEIETKDIPPIVLIRAFEYWSKLVEVMPGWLPDGNYPEAFLKAVNDTWFLEYASGNNIESGKILSLAIGFYSISSEEKRLIECLNFNLEDKDYIKVINDDADLQKICNLLNSKTKELLSDYTQSYNHSYIYIKGGPLDGQCFIPAKNIIISDTACSVLHLPKNDSVLEFDDEKDDNGYGYWTLTVKYFEDYFQDGIIFFSTKGDWNIEYLTDSNKYHLIEKNNWYETESSICNGTIDECLSLQTLHKNAYQKGREAGKKTLANSIISTCENLVL